VCVCDIFLIMVETIGGNSQLANRELRLLVTALLLTDAM